MTASSRARICAAILLMGAISSGIPASRPATATPLSEVEQFYAGHSISLVIGFGVGGGYDVYGRLLARFMGKYIPSNPKLIPQNMTGAGSLRAANYLYSVAPKDGSVIATFSRALPLAPLLGRAQYDSRHFTRLGSVSRDVVVCFTWHTSPVKTWSDLLSKPSALGGDGPGAEPDIYALLYKNLFDAKVKLVSGYHGMNDIFLAIERGEVDGACGVSWGTLTALHPDWVRDKKINVIVQAGHEKQPDLVDIPSVFDFTKSQEQAAILRLILTSLAMARPFAAPPDVPASRKAALISAFELATKDAEFQADAKTLNLDVDLVSARTIDALLAQAYATPKDVIEKAIQAITK
jgi:tripartite-type tricarboxylate transporter receptor subunit TctC